ncbi:MAG: DUF2007 domain-containing protein [Candidatus Omnitrophota bacterium]|jgi:hypothetical protein
MMGDLVSIKSFMRRYEAELAKGLLTEKEIEAIVSADDCGGMRFDIGMGRGGIRLLVKKEDAEKAKEVLKVLEDSKEQE